MKSMKVGDLVKYRPRGSEVMYGIQGARWGGVNRDLCAIVVEMHQNAVKVLYPQDGSIISGFVGNYDVIGSDE